MGCTIKTVYTEPTSVHKFYIDIDMDDYEELIKTIIPPPPPSRNGRIYPPHIFDFHQSPSFESAHITQILLE